MAEPGESDPRVLSSPVPTGLWDSPVCWEGARAKSKCLFHGVIRAALLLLLAQLQGSRRGGVYLNEEKISEQGDDTLLSLAIQRPASSVQVLDKMF